jgi:hypothetical protein
MKTWTAQVMKLEGSNNNQWRNDGRVVKKLLQILSRRKTARVFWFSIPLFYQILK